MRGSGRPQTGIDSIISQLKKTLLEDQREEEREEEREVHRSTLAQLRTLPSELECRVVTEHSKSANRFIVRQNFKVQERRKRAERVEESRVSVLEEEIKRLKMSSRVARVRELEQSLQGLQIEVKSLREQGAHPDERVAEHNRELAIDNLEMHRLLKDQKEQMSKLVLKEKNSERLFVQLRKEKNILRHELDYAMEQIRESEAQETMDYYEAQLQREKAISDEKDSSIERLQDQMTCLKQDLDSTRDSMRKAKKTQRETQHQMQESMDEVVLKSEQQQDCLSMAQNQKRALEHKWAALKKIMEVQENDIEDILNNVMDKHQQTLFLQELLARKVQQSITLKEQGESGLDRMHQSVKQYQVKKIAQLVRETAIARRLPYQDIESTLLGQQRQNKHTSIIQLMTVLKQPPFQIQGQKDLLLFCRYLVEDNQKTQVLINYDEEHESLRVGSVFRTLVGKYSLLSETQQRDSYTAISALFLKYAGGLQEYLQEQMDRNNRTFLVPEDIDRCLAFLGVSLDSQTTQYLYNQMFQRSGELHRVRLAHLVQQFDGRSFSADQESL